MSAVRLITKHKLAYCRRPRRDGQQAEVMVRMCLRATQLPGRNHIFSQGQMDRDTQITSVDAKRVARVAW